MIQKVSIGGTVNVGNYESLRLEIEADTFDEAKSAIRECLKSLASTHSMTHDLIETWSARVIGREIV